jgi:hypothetical protein
MPFSNLTLGVSPDISPINIMDKSSDSSSLEEVPLKRGRHDDDAFEPPSEEEGAKRGRKRKPVVAKEPSLPPIEETVASRANPIKEMEVHIESDEESNVVREKDGKKELLNEKDRAGVKEKKEKKERHREREHRHKDRDKDRDVERDKDHDRSRTRDRDKEKKKDKRLRRKERKEKKRRERREKKERMTPEEREKRKEKKRQKKAAKKIRRQRRKEKRDERRRKRRREEKSSSSGEVSSESDDDSVSITSSADEDDKSSESSGPVDEKESSRKTSKAKLANTKPLPSTVPSSGAQGGANALIEFAQALGNSSVPTTRNRAGGKPLLPGIEVVPPLPKRAKEKKLIDISNPPHSIFPPTRSFPTDGVEIMPLNSDAERSVTEINLNDNNPTRPPMPQRVLSGPVSAPQRPMPVVDSNVFQFPPSYSSKPIESETRGLKRSLEATEDGVGLSKEPETKKQRTQD